MFIRLMALLALLLPVAALAQVAPKTTTVEILGSATLDVPATSYAIGASWTITASDEAAARKEQAVRQTAVRAALRKAGVLDAAMKLTPGTDFTTTENMVYENSTVYEAVVDNATGELVENSSDDWPTEPSTTVTDSVTIRATSFEQATAIRKALSSLNVMVDMVTPLIDDTAAARRRAKTTALDNARADAMAYASALGMHIVRVSRISETGNGLLLPGFQDKFQQMIVGGPSSMRGLFEARPGFVHFEATIVVEFELAP